MTKKNTPETQAKIDTAVAAKTATATPVMTEKQLYTKDQLNAAITKASTAGMKVQQEYQKIACSAILHLGQHKDIRVIRHILDTLPVGLRKQSLSAFFDAFAPVAFDEAGEVTYDKTKAVKLGEALKTSWWLAAKEPVYKPFVFMDELNKLLARAEKRVATATPDKGDSLSQKEVTALAKFVGSLMSTVQPEDVLAAA
jgi:hypothetical protein